MKEIRGGFSQENGETGVYPAENNPLMVLLAFGSHFCCSHRVTIRSGLDFIQPQWISSWRNQLQGPDSHSLEEK